MPVLKIDPNTGESLNKAKTAKEAAQEEENRQRALDEYKKRLKTKKSKKKKVEIEEEPAEIAVSVDKEVSLAVVKKVDIPVKIRPLDAPNGEIVVDELLGPLNTILKDIEHKLELMTKGYKLNNDKLDISAKVNVPKEFIYKPGITRIQDGSEAFQLVKPSGVTTLKFDELKKDIYVDRILLNPIEIKELLKDADKAAELLENLIIHNMWKTLWETKQLDSKKKYFGSVVATLKRPGMDENYAFKYTGDIDFIEIRLFSDITEAK